MHNNTCHMCVLELSKNLIKFLKDIYIWVVCHGLDLSVQGQFSKSSKPLYYNCLIIYYADNCRFVCERLSFHFMFKCVRYVFWINQIVVMCLVNDCIRPTSREQILPVTCCNNPVVIMTSQTYFSWSFEYNFNRIHASEISRTLSLRLAVKWAVFYIVMLKLMMTKMLMTYK